MHFQSHRKGWIKNMSPVWHTASKTLNVMNIYCQSTRMDFIFVEYMHMYFTNTGIVDLLLNNPEYEYSHQWSLQVEGLSVLKKQHDVSFQVTQTAVTMTPNPLLQQQM